MKPVSLDKLEAAIRECHGIIDDVH